MLRKGVFCIPVAWGVACAVGLCAPWSDAVAEGPTAVCDIQDRRIDEASGIVASRRHPGCYYVHNDSGDLPRVFLIDRDGRTRAVIRLKGAQAVDYEDIALAPGKSPGVWDVCVADIGDNESRRSHVAIYRFPETELPSEPGATIEVEPTAYRARYQDGPADAEAFMVHPRTGHGYILTKRLDGRSVVYKLTAPWDAQREMVAAKVLTLELPPAPTPLRIVTAADISPDGQRVAVRCCVEGWEWRLPPGTADADFERIFQTPPARLPLAAEGQGEALCYAADGQAILTISEGVSPTLYELRAAPPPTSGPSSTAPFRPEAGQES
jgi:hypothetical protein